jgi:hypothetical protein
MKGSDTGEFFYAEIITHIENALLCWCSKNFAGIAIG